MIELLVVIAIIAILAALLLPALATACPAVVVCHGATNQPMRFYRIVSP